MVAAAAQRTGSPAPGRADRGLRKEEWQRGMHVSGRFLPYSHKSNRACIVDFALQTTDVNSTHYSTLLQTGYSHQ